MYGSVNTAGISQDTIKKLNATADDAVTKANLAQETANNATTLANTAQASANSAKTAAADVQSNLDTFIVNAGKTYAPIASPTFTGTPKVPTPANGANENQIVNIAYLLAQINAKLNSIPTFTSPTASAAGKEGLVPPPPKGTETFLLTSEGWKKSTDTAFYVGGTSVQKGTLTYNGSEQAVVWANFDANKMSVSGTTAAKNAGTYSTIFTPRGLYVWEDGTQSPREIFWTINPKVYAKPTASVTTFTYSGSEITLAVSNFDSTVINQTGTVKATAKGNYTATYALKDNTNTAWADGTTADVVISWAINVKTYKKPTAAVTTFTYDKQAHTLNVSNFDSNVMSQTGTVTATVKGDYVATYKLKDKNNTAWADGSTADVNINWNVAIRKLTKPSASTTTYTYTGNAITIAVSNYDSAYMNETGTKTSTNAATGLSLKYVLADKTNTCWADNTTTDVTITWSIARAKLTAAQGTFSQSGTLTYNGSAQSPTISNFNSAYHVLGGVTSKTDVGAYTATVAPDANHAWNDGTFAAKNVSWSIGLLKIAKPSASTTSYTCTGVAITLAVSNFNASYITATNNSKIAPGDYTATYALSNSLNVVWADGSTDAVAIDWHITVAKLAKPYATGSYEYTGSNITVTLVGFNSNLMNVSGNVQKNAGNHTATISLKNTSYATWSDNSTGNVSANWSIDKAYPTISLNRDILWLDVEHSSTVTVTTSGGDVSVRWAERSDSDYCNATVNGKSITFTQKKARGNTYTTAYIDVAETANTYASYVDCWVYTSKISPNLKFTTGFSNGDYFSEHEVAYSYKGNGNIRFETEGCEVIMETDGHSVYASNKFVYTAQGQDSNATTDKATLKVILEESDNYEGAEATTSATVNLLDFGDSSKMKYASGVQWDGNGAKFPYGTKFSFGQTYGRSPTVQSVRSSRASYTLGTSAIISDSDWEFEVKNKKVTKGGFDFRKQNAMIVCDYQTGYSEDKGTCNIVMKFPAKNGWRYKEVTWSCNIGA